MCGWGSYSPRSTATSSEPKVPLTRSVIGPDGDAHCSVAGSHHRSVSREIEDLSADRFMGWNFELLKAD